METKSYSSEKMQLTPVGEVHSAFKAPMLVARESDIELQERKEKVKEYHDKVQQAVSEVIVFPEWEALLDGIEAFSHILILFWPHLVDPERRNLKKVHPMGRKDLPQQGIFATCSPARPNPVLVSPVRLLERDGNILRVEGLDAVDGSPVIDIKPYLPGDYKNKLEAPQWMKQIHEELGTGLFEED